MVVEITWRERLRALRDGFRRIHEFQDAGPCLKACWYLLEPIGWARHQWDTRRW